jgi:predicted branched-subunit amino acid permease
LSIDESNAVSSAQIELKDQKLGFWLTGAAVFVFWNLATYLGAVMGELFGSVETWGLDAAAAAAFLGLLWPRLKKQWPLALVAALVATLLTPWLPAGSAILAAVLVAFLPIRAKK